MLKKLLSTPTAQLGKASRFVVFQIKLWSHCARLLKKNRSGQQAAALSYHTLFGIVPLAIVTLLIFQAMPAYSDYGEKIRSFVYDWAGFSGFKSTIDGDQGSKEMVVLTDHLDKIVTKFFAGTYKGSITFFSVILVIWAAMALLSTIEKAFNNIWHIGRGRGLLHRIVNYWAVVTLGPLLIATGIYAAAQYSSIGHIHENILLYVAPVISSYIVATFVFFLLYFVLPNTRVQARAAIWGAAVAALVWIAAKNTYGYCVTELELYSTLYGVLALVPITVLWIYITWLIVLFGLQLTFTTQHLKSLDAAQIAVAGKREEYFIASEFTAINIVREIAAAFEQNKAPVSSEIISSKLNIPAELNEKMLDHLVGSGIIVKASEPRPGFVPAQDPENIRLSDIAQAVAAAGFAQSTITGSQSLDQIAQSQRNALANYSLKQILNTGQED